MLLTNLLQIQVLALEKDRRKAVADAQDARSEVADLQQTCDRVELQNKLLQKLLDVQQKHNRNKVESIQRFLTSGSWYSGANVASDISTSSSSSNSSECSDEEDNSSDAASTEHRMEDLLRAFHVIEQQRNMPPALLSNGGLKRHKPKHHSSKHKKGHK